jgi:hypothetical protein
MLGSVDASMAGSQLDWSENAEEMLSTPRSSVGRPTRLAWATLVEPVTRQATLLMTRTFSARTALRLTTFRV